MPIAVVVALAIFWAFMAFRALERGDVAMAAVFLMVGVVLTIYRLKNKKV